MDLPVILSKLEQEYLLGCIEAALQLDEPRRLFLWAQGQLQALLPHQALVALQLGDDGRVRDVQCAYGAVLEASALARLAGTDGGLAGQLACLWREGAARPAILETHPAPNGAGQQRLAPLRPALLAAQREHAGGPFANALVHGSGRLPGGGTFFALFGMPFRPGPRHAYFLELLMPHMHLALLRMAAGRSPAETGAPVTVPDAGRPVSRRELEILQWVREGKNNEEIGRLLGISGLTVKNHLQRIYKTMGVANRAQAVARGIALRLLAPSDGPSHR